jgi:hypothetical protein
MVYIYNLLYNPPFWCEYASCCPLNPICELLAFWPNGWKKFQKWILLYYIILYFIILYCILLYYIILNDIIWYDILLYYFILYYVFIFIYLFSLFIYLFYILFINLYIYSEGYIFIVGTMPSHEIGFI